MSEAASEVEVFSTIHVEVEKYAKSLGLCAKQCGDVHSTMPGFKVEFDDFDASKLGTELLICEPPTMASVEGALFHLSMPSPYARQVCREWHTIPHQY
jgi:hypothetical protein